MFWVYLFILGGLGCCLRWLLSDSMNSSTFPWGTLLVNVIGAFLIAVLARIELPQAFKLALMVGLLGGMTTFSSFALELLSFIESQRWLALGTYLFTSLTLGLGLCYLGTKVAVRWFLT